MCRFVITGMNSGKGYTDNMFISLKLYTNYKYYLLFLIVYLNYYKLII